MSLAQNAPANPCPADATPTPDGRLGGDVTPVGPLSWEASDLIESIDQAAENEAPAPTDCAIETPETVVSVTDDPPDTINAPTLSPWRIFVLFLGFGIRAFGGPVAQINIMKDELVVTGKWISMKRFMRAYAAYQVLPGPEATELACYFGMLAGGPLGGLLGGLGFIAPGVSLMLLFSWFYYSYGINNRVFVAVFHGLQPAVCAMVVRAAHKIGESTCRHHHGSGELDWRLFLTVWLAAFESVLHVNFFITKAHLIAVYLMIRRGWYVTGAVACVAPIIVFIAIIAVYGDMGDLVPQGFGIAQRLGNSLGSEFLVGLVGGLVSFGGAYTSIPFIQYEAVTSGAWIQNQQFLDSLAVCSLLPAPLVSFVVLVGYVANGGPGGAVVMALGMFAPALLLPVVLHKHLDILVGSTQESTIGIILDGVAATTVGLICVSAVQLLRTSVTSPLHAVIFIAALQALYAVKSTWTPMLVVVAAGMAGFVLFF